MASKSRLVRFADCLVAAAFFAAFGHAGSLLAQESSSATENIAGLCIFSIFAEVQVAREACGVSENEVDLAMQDAVVELKPFILTHYEFSEADFDQHMRSVRDMWNGMSGNEQQMEAMCEGPNSSLSFREAWTTEVVYELTAAILRADPEKLTLDCI